MKLPDPGYRFAAKAVFVRVILNGKGNVLAGFREHDIAQRAEMQKRQNVPAGVPDALHFSSPDHRQSVFAAHAETLLHFRVQFFKIVSQVIFIYRHVCFQFNSFQFIPSLRGIYLVLLWNLERVSDKFLVSSLGMR